MNEVRVIDRKTKKEEIEKIYFKRALLLFYGTGFFAKIFSKTVLPIIAGCSFFSCFCAFLQNRKCSRKKIRPFIEKFEVDPSEFVKPIEAFSSFNDFFIRKLKPDTRPIVSGEKRAILPADGRYLVFPKIDKTNGFYVKGQKFSLDSFLKNPDLAKKYEKGSLVIGRLCPTDYHRVHFPFDCTPQKSTLINGFLYSVNPLALRKNIEIFTENKRVITTLISEVFGPVIFVEIGATNVGTIHLSFTPKVPYHKGDEKGYFSFGGSSIVMLFEENRIAFDEDLKENSSRKIETKALFGQSLGKAIDLYR